MPSKGSGLGILALWLSVAGVVADQAGQKGGGPSGLVEEPGSFGNFGGLSSSALLPHGLPSPCPVSFSFYLPFPLEPDRAPRPKGLSVGFSGLGFSSSVAGLCISSRVCCKPAMSDGALERFAVRESISSLWHLVSCHS